MENLEEPCKCCGRTLLTAFSEILNKDFGIEKILEARESAFVNQKITWAEIELPMILGASGKAIYGFDGRFDKKDHK